MWQINISYSQLSFFLQVTSVADKALDNGIKKYNKEKGAKQFYDWIQPEFKCCGNNGKGDWKNTGNTTIPESCCKTKTNTTATCMNEASNVFKKGCKQSFEDWCKAKLVLIGGFALAVAFVQIIGIIFACCMMHAIKGQYEVV